MQERTVEAGGLSIAICEAGTGERHLLLVHGFTGAKEDFGEVLDRFADAGWHAVAPDLRGHGSTSQPASEDAYGLELFADDLWGLVDAGEQDDPFLGHAQRMARAIRTARLVVIPDAGHSPQFENTAAWWDALASFLEEVA